MLRPGIRLVLLISLPRLWKDDQSQDKRKTESESSVVTSIRLIGTNAPLEESVSPTKKDGKPLSPREIKPFPKRGNET
jgi:hypothetical protein